MSTDLTEIDILNSPGNISHDMLSTISSQRLGMKVQNPIQIVIVDDHAVVRAGLRMLIEANSKLKVVGEAGNCKEALSSVAELQPDIILLDVDLNKDDGLELIPELLASSTKSRVLVLTGMRDPEIHHRSVRLGACGLVMKEMASDVLLKAIVKVHAGEFWFDHAIMGNVLAEYSSKGANKKADPEVAKIGSVTEREHEIIALIGEGLKNKQIAERLFISETTVRHHLTSVFNKLEVSDRLELIIYAFRHGLAKAPR